MGPRIVIVEDEPAIADTLQYALETDGCRTLRLDCGRPLLALLATEQVDLVVLDVGLPDISGFELCKEIRKSHAVPIIFLTARADEVDRVVGLEIGGDDYVTKPFSPREVAARVKAVLRRGTSPPPAPSAQRYFDLDEVRRQIRFLGHPLTLSRYEYEILRLLIQRPGRVFSRQQIMDLAWEEPEASMDRTVDAHIRNLRAKLKAVAPEHDPIVTHRGVGYSLQEGA
ncbi:MAG: two-component system response regulator CreB [Desulfobulbaceae bacterium A2]|nr:MAG: two-component system response regulator CreB [Desulfobulbaceae bacterium A2]